MKVYGIQKPKVENKTTILKKAIKYNMDTTNIVSVGSRDFLSTLAKNGIPDAAIYDKHGRYIEYRQTDTSCNAGLFKFIPELSLTGKYNQPDSANLDSELLKYRDLMGNTLPTRVPADFYVLIYWTTWAGRLNEDHVKVWENLALANKNCDIAVIKVNLDIQAYWEPAEQEKFLAAFKNQK